VERHQVLKVVDQWGFGAVLAVAGHQVARGRGRDRAEEADAQEHRPSGVTG
jgi:hypothetical protein